VLNARPEIASLLAPQQVYARRMKKLPFSAAAIVCLQLPITGRAQDAVPTEILGRTVAVRGATEQGTAFAIDYGGKLYEITARHVMAGVADQRPMNVQIRKGSEWLALPVTRILCSGLGRRGHRHS
jgi:hypothetical protein